MATVSTASTADQFQVLANEVKRKYDNRRTAREVIPFQYTLTIPTTYIDNADDLVNVLPFPAGDIWLLDLKIRFPTEIDSNATPTLVHTLKLSDGTSLIAGSTAGRADGDVDALDATVEPYINVGGLTLQWDPTTAAATAVAGTMVISGRVSFSMIQMAG